MQSQWKDVQKLLAKQLLALQGLLRDYDRRTSATVRLSWHACGTCAWAAPHRTALVCGCVHNRRSCMRCCARAPPAEPCLSFSSPPSTQRFATSAVLTHLASCLIRCCSWLTLLLRLCCVCMCARACKQGLLRLQKSLDGVCSNIETLAVQHAARAGEAIVAHLSHLRGLALCDHTQVPLPSRARTRSLLPC